MRLLLIGICLFSVLGCFHSFAQEQKEKPKEAFVKIFNACQRNGVEKWQAGLDLRFHGTALANDVRVGEAGMIRQIIFLEKDSVDVFRCEKSAEKTRTLPAPPIARIQTAFEQRSITLLLIHGRLDVEGESIEVDAIREFPVPVESTRPGMARVLLMNVWPGGNVELELSGHVPLSLPLKKSREVFFQPGETEIFLSYTGKDGENKKQITVFRLMPDCSYTGIVCSAAELPDRPSIRLSDSNEGWATIRSPSKEATP